MMQIHFSNLHSPTRCSMFVAAARFEVYRRNVKETPDGHVMTGAVKSGTTTAEPVTYVSGTRRDPSQKDAFAERPHRDRCQNITRRQIALPPEFILFAKGCCSILSRNVYAVSMTPRYHMHCRYRSAMLSIHANNCGKS